MREAISAAILTELSCELGNEELGAAIRLISRLCETKRPISTRTAHISAGMDKKSWEEISDAILPFFVVSEEGIHLPGMNEDQDDADGETISIRKSQKEMNLLVRPNRRATVPKYATAERPPNVSIRKAIYDQAISLFKDAGMAENTARAILASMLKNYPEGDVAMAVSDASKKDALAEPHTWIFGRLKAEARKRNSTKPTTMKPTSQNKIATPEITGISRNKADRIRAQNASLKLNI